MQIRTYSLPASFYQKETFIRYPPYAVTETGGLVAGYHTRSGSASAIVQGDRVHPNPHSFNYTERSNYVGYYQLNDGYTLTQRDGAVNNQYDRVIHRSDLTSADVSWPYNKALEKLYAGIRSGTDLSIDIYQGRQTVQMLRTFSKALVSPLRTIALATKSLVRKKKISRSSSMISNKWLEWQYGIKPSLDTIHSLTSDLVKQTTHPSGFLQAKARSSNRAQTSNKLLTGTAPHEIPTTVNVNAERRVEIAIVYGISNAELNALSQFTSLNPVSFIYENIPFSFVLDWIVDIGGYIRNLETALMTGLEFKSGYVTYSDNFDFIASTKGYSGSSMGRTYYVNAQASFKTRSCNRIVLGAMPLPEVPRIEISLGTSRLTSAAALLRGFIKR